MFKRLIPFKIKRKIKENLGVPSLQWSLQNLKKNGFNPRIIFDIGAYEGHWALDVLEVFPNATVFMVEAQENKNEILKKVSKAYPNINHAIALLSSTDGAKKLFFENETGSEIVEHKREGEKCYEIATTKLDTLLEQKGIPFPNFLKLDVQGHELEVLKGATNALKNAEVCLLEVSLMDFGNKIPLLAEMISFMDKNNFQAYDISQFMRRPYDKALFQLDMFFVKKDSNIIESKRWN